MRCGRPVICSDIPQFVERLGTDDALALTFDPYSPQSLAAAFAEHFADPARAESRARAAQKFITSRTLSDVGRDYLAAFESVLVKSAPHE
jgi:glycosyltransferase involved in cell wall biosynthesis